MGMSKEPTVEQLREWSIPIAGFVPNPNYDPESGGQYKWMIQDSDGNMSRIHALNWIPDKNRDQLAQVVMKWNQAEFNRWNDLAIEINGGSKDDPWNSEDIDQVLRAIFTNPEIVLRALYNVVEASNNH
jgi:hypothetical protein